MEELKEKIAKIFDVHIDRIQGAKTGDDCGMTPLPYYLTFPQVELFTNQIISLLKEHNYVRLDEDQTILMPCYEDGDETKCTYIKAQPPSWITEANFKKVKSD